MYLREGVQVKWSMDTHKYMSEITRTALQVIANMELLLNLNQKKLMLWKRNS